MKYNTEMSNSHLSYLKSSGTTWFNPCNGIIMFWDEYRKVSLKYNISHQETWKHRDLKRAKEIFCASIVAKSIECQTKKGLWYIMKPKNDPPDAVVGTIVNDGKNDSMQVREVEVVEIFGENITELIVKKLTGKFYEPNTILVCFLEPNESGPVNVEKVAKEIQNIETSLLNIFLVFPGMFIKNVSDLEKELENKSEEERARYFFKYTLVQVKPIYTFETIDPIQACESWSKGEEINFYIHDNNKQHNKGPIHLENPPMLF